MGQEDTREESQEKAYEYWLYHVPEIGNATIRKLLDVYGSARGIYDAGEECFKEAVTARQLDSIIRSRMEWNLFGEYDRLKEQGIIFTTWEQKDYPERLRQIPDAPYGIFCKGKLPENHPLTVSVVGARECSEYGRYVAQGLGKVLGENGVPVISGMARGVDSICQMAALEAGGISYGVLGCGVDVCYPAGNRKLYEKLTEKGGVLSILPPGTMPRPQYFPPRNRIVSGLADVIVVVEARNRSGTLITVDMALEQGKEVYVVPGRITDRLSDGCNRLLKQGAGVILSPMDFLEEIGGKGSQDTDSPKITEQTERGNGAEKETAGMSPMMKIVYEALDLYPRSMDEILSRVPGSMDVMQIYRTLLELCMMQKVKQLSPGHFCIMGEEK